MQQIKNKSLISLIDFFFGPNVPCDLSQVVEATDGYAQTQIGTPFALVAAVHRCVLFNRHRLIKGSGP